MTRGTEAVADSGPVAPSHDLFMHRPTLDDLPELPPLPAGYTLRPSRAEDRAGLAVLLRRAFNDETWTAQRVSEVLTDAADVETVFVIAHADGLVATASVQIQDQSAATGWLHWVATDPGHQGTGLGTHVCLAVLRRLRQLDFDEARLNTQDYRLPAIRAYLRLGFVPEYRDHDEQRRWSRVFPRLLPTGAPTTPR